MLSKSLSKKEKNKGESYICFSVSVLKGAHVVCKSKSHFQELDLSYTCVGSENLTQVLRLRSKLISWTHLTGQCWDSDTQEGLQPTSH